jgi:hypothetical protein
MMWRMLSFCIGALTVFLAACTGGGENADLQPTICPQFVALKTLVYPAPGSTKIPDALGSVVISGPSTQLSLQPSTAGQAPIVVATTGPVPSPLPSPNAPPASGTIAFPVGTLAPATTYSVTVQDGTGPCPEAQPVNIGSFTTL